MDIRNKIHTKLSQIYKKEVELSFPGSEDNLNNHDTQSRSNPDSEKSLTNIIAAESKKLKTDCTAESEYGPMFWTLWYFSASWGYLEASPLLFGYEPLYETDPASSLLIHSVSSLIGFIHGCLFYRDTIKYGPP